MNVTARGRAGKAIDLCGGRPSLTVSIKVRLYAHFFVLCVRNDECERMI